MRIALAAALVGVAVAAAAATTGGAERGVPQGFRPESGAAVGVRDLWVLGDYRCSGSWCLALVRSTDGGNHFGRVGLPAFPSSGIDPTVVFASPREGFAYVDGETPLYATHDGGESWQRSGPAAAVRAFAAAGGYAYLVSGHERFERSRIGRGAWRKLSLPFSTLGGPVGLSAQGSHVWVVGTSPPANRPYSDLGRSDDHGSRFVVKHGPCYAGLPGGVTPAGQRALWAVCSSGMMASLSLSTNDGRSFAIRSFHDPGGVRLPSLTNAASIAASSARVAVLTRGAGGAFLRTTDEGRHWILVPRTAEVQAVPWFAFTTHDTADAVVLLLHDREELWRTTDNGATWHSMRIR